MPTQSFLRILELLDQHGVEYIVVGGVAAVLQGAPVTTFDIDTLVKVDAANADRLAAALAALDARHREHNTILRPSREDLLAGGHLLLLTNCGPLDVLGFIGRSRRYEDLEDSISMVTVGALSVPVLSLDALIAEKKALGRDKDQAAVRLLEAVQRKRSERGADDPYELRRFMAAQEGSYARALTEIRSGRKQSHWMWYIFPQYEGLGSSPTSRRYAIKSLAEAEAYLRHPILGPRLTECAEAALGVGGRSASELFGSPDDLKLKSCATLFAAVSPAGSVFERLLDAFFRGNRDEKTLRLISGG